jgi:hypothetical protein
MASNYKDKRKVLKEKYSNIINSITQSSEIQSMEYEDMRDQCIRKEVYHSIAMNDVNHLLRSNSNWMEQEIKSMSYSR